MQRFMFGKPGPAAVRLALAAVFMAGPVAAQELTYNRVDLNVSAESEVANDEMIAVVYAEVEDNDQTEAAAAVNESIRWATERARAVAGVELQTLQYTTRAVYAPNSRRIVGWIARQSLRLQSGDAEALSTLLGELQQRVAVQSLGSGLSKTARDAAEQALIAEAIAAFEQRAATVAGELGRSDYRLVHMSVGTSGFRPLGLVTGFGARSDLAIEAVAPEIEAGVQTVSVSVSGTIELTEAD